MRSKKAIKEAQKRYEASGVIVRKYIKLHTTHDADILEYISGLENFTGSMKQMLREQMKKQS